MRKNCNPQRQFGQLSIGQIEFDPRFRDSLTKLLRGLQFIYTTPAVRDEVFAILAAQAARQADPRNGRPGLDLWAVLVMGTLRLNLDWDYDLLLNQVNYHDLIRQMLGHGPYDRTGQYKRQTVQDNLRLLTPEVLERINAVVVRAGHAALKKNDVALEGRGDSFVVETDVHYPTDINLLWDAVRKAVELTAELAEANGLSGWRKSRYWRRELKRRFRAAQQAKRPAAGDPARQAAQEEAVQAAHEAYLAQAAELLERVTATMALLAELKEVNLAEIERFVRHGRRQLDQVRRRVLLGETIPHGEKVFSLFEPHTEWISKGKAGVPVELGLRVAVLADQFGFLLDHRVMVRETDDQVAVPMVAGAQAKFPRLSACSFDKGFHSPDNQTRLRGLLERVVLPRKGKLSQAARAVESEAEFVRARRQHAAVESAINALEVHGLDRCPGHGLDGFQRYVGLAVVARNIQHLGAILRKQDARAAKRRAALRRVS